ncbi:MAG: MFS transporter [Flavobacteriales bacterium]|nr:MFS transporter [Flavobacteriales bacterium]
MAALVSLVTLIMIMVWLPESLTNLTPRKRNGRNILKRLFGQAHKDCHQEQDKSTSLKELSTLPGVTVMLLVYGLVFLAFSLFYAGFPAYVSEVLGWDAAQLGIFLAVSSTIIFVVDSFFLKSLNKIFGDKMLIIIGAMMITISMCLLPLQDPLVLWIANVLLSLGNGVMWPSFMARFSQHAGADKQGALMGYGNSMGSGGSIIGLILGGTLFGLIQGGVFYVGAIVFLVIALVMLLKKSPTPGLQTEEALE